MEDEEVGALLSAAGIGWIRVLDGASSVANDVARRLRLDGPPSAWGLDAAERGRLEEIIAELAPSTTRTVRVHPIGDGGEPQVLRVSARRSGAALDLLIAEETELARAQRDLAEAEEVIALLPPHVFWETADVSKQQTIQARLEAMVAERTAELERQVAVRERAERAALDASRAKSEFLTNFSHELRTPLNAILGYTELIRESIADGDADMASVGADIERIAGAGEVLRHLIAEILDLSRIEAGKVVVCEDELDLDPWLAGVVREFDACCRAKGTRCEVAAASAVGVVVADGDKLRKILRNLLSNACKFTADGRIDVRAALVDDGRAIEIVVRDTGIGISPERLATIFEPFIVASVSAADREAGVGLGLAVSRRYAELMGATVTVDSELGVGTTARVIFPRRSP
ncbi:MAG: HAMP domain-containing histidine kinase [Myxococcales bacterium]|nr:HAMP domain-containing histidine kinase [Myxococcales bacterium]